MYCVHTTFIQKIIQKFEVLKPYWVKYKLVSIGIIPIITKSCFYHYSINSVILWYLSNEKQSMSVKKQISSLSKLYTIYEEVPESFLDETDVDSYFYHNIVDIALIDNRVVRVSKGSNKKIFAFKLFQFCNLKNQQRFILEEEVSVSLKELAAILNTLRQFLKQYDKTVKYPALYPLPKPKQEIYLLLYLKTNSLHIISKTLKNIATDRYVFLFVLSVTRNVVSLSKSFKLLVSKTF